MAQIIQKSPGKAKIGLETQVIDMDTMILVNGSSQIGSIAENHCYWREVVNLSATRRATLNNYINKRDRTNNPNIMQQQRMWIALQPKDGTQH